VAGAVHLSFVSDWMALESRRRVFEGKSGSERVVSRIPIWFVREPKVQMAGHRGSANDVITTGFRVVWRNLPARRGVTEASNSFGFH